MPEEKIDYIISNPPYSIKDKILQRLDSLNMPFAMLLPLPTLQGKARYEVFKNGIEALIFDGRVNYLEQDKGNAFASIYIFVETFYLKNLYLKN